MRAFLAINLPPEVRAGIAAATRKLREADLPVRWVDERQLHLTLKFIGEAAEDRVFVLSGATAEVARGHSRFPLRVGGFGAFPSLRSPRVLWIGVERSDPLVEVKRELEEAMARHGVEREDRSFHPHITLGRTRRRFAAEEKQRLAREAAAVSYGAECGVETLDLMRSRLSREGARYSVVDAHPLGGSSDAGRDGDAHARGETPA